MSVKKKNFMSIVLILVLIGSAVLSFAYWDNLKKDVNDQLTVGLGTKTVVEEVITSENNYNLIPKGALLGKNDVEQITKEYNVTLSKKTEEPLNLNVKISDIKIGNLEYEGLLNIDAKYNPIIEDTTKVVLEISMNNLDIDYLDIYNQKITFVIEFSVVNNNDGHN